MKMLRSLAAASLALVLAVSAHAQGGMSLGWGQKPNPPQSGTNPQGTLKVAIVGGVASLDSSGVPFQFDASGNLKQIDTDRDRDFPVLTSLFSSVVLNSSATFQQGTAIYIGQYSKPTLMMRWASSAAADSDSTFWLVRIWGKTSLNSGTLHLWTPFTGNTLATGDTCYCNKTVADSAGAATMCITPPPSFVVTRAAVIPSIGWTKVVASVYGGTATTRASLRKIPNWALRFGGAQGVMIPLVDQAGNACPFPYILAEVWNLSFTRAFTSVSLDVWPRVN